MKLFFQTIILFSFTSSLLAQATSSAAFEPSRIIQGNTARYVITIEDADESIKNALLKSTPAVPYLNLSYQGKYSSSSNFNIVINGQTVQDGQQPLQHFIFEAKTSKAGSFTIPSFTVPYKNKSITIPAATLIARERTASDPPPLDQIAFVEVDQSEDIYVGQDAVVELKLFTLEQLEVQGIGNFNTRADAFTGIELVSDQARLSQATRNNRKYEVHTWQVSMVPLSSGLQDAKFGLTISVARLDRNGRKQYGIFGRLQTNSLKVSTPSNSKIEVLPLPEEGRPESFSGAIGKFNLSALTDRKSAKAGEPVMLSVIISGQGNFNRIQAPELPNSDGWRNYPPESMFEPNAKNKFIGTKRFDYVFVPEKAGMLELPEVSFSFFDPAVKEYVELNSPAIAVEVAPSNIPLAGITASTDSKDETNEEPPANLTRILEPEEVLSTLDYQPKKGRTVSVNGSITPLFYWLNSSLLVIASTAAILIYQRQRLLKSPHYELVHNARQELKIALNKTTSEDTATFFSNAQKAIRLAATIRTKSSLQTAHLATLKTHLKKSEMDETTIDQIRNLFETAEKHQFSGHQREVSLDEHRKQLKTLLKVITD